MQRKDHYAEMGHERHFAILYHRGFKNNMFVQIFLFPNCDPRARRPHDNQQLQAEHLRNSL